MIEGPGSRAGSGSGFKPQTNGSGYGRPKNTWIWWIRNTASLMKSGRTCSEEAGLAGSISADHDVLSRPERPHHRPLTVRLEAFYNNGLDVHFFAFLKEHHSFCTMQSNLGAW